MHRAIVHLINTARSHQPIQRTVSAPQKVPVPCQKVRIPASFLAHPPPGAGEAFDRDGRQKAQASLRRVMATLLLLGLHVEHYLIVLINAAEAIRRGRLNVTCGHPSSTAR